MFNNPTAITFVGYIVLLILLGFIAWYCTKSFSDYILGGRRLGAFVTAMSACASDMSGWLLMGLPGAVYASGLCEAWIAIGLTAGAYLNWKFVAGRLRAYTEAAHNALTLPDYFTHRFNDTSRMLRIFSAVVILVFFTIYCASGLVAGARLFENTFSIDYYDALLISAAVTLAYLIIGGFLAVSWTDTFQATLMCGALILVPFVVMDNLGGITPTIESVRAIDPNRLNLFTNQSMIGIISLLAWGLGYFGQPHILVRFMAAKNIHVIPKACRISVLWMIFSLGGAIAVGFFGTAFFSAHPEHATLVVQNNERIFIVISQILFNPWIGGVLMAAILSSVLSTLSAQLLVCSTTLTADFYRPFLRPSASNRELLWIGRSMVLAVAIIAGVIAWDPNSLVFGLVSYAWAGFGAAFGPVILIGLWWKRMNRNGALAGMLTGAVTVLVWHQFGWLGLYEIIPGFIAASIAIVVVTLAGATPDASVAKTFDAVEEHMRQG